MSDDPMEGSRLSKLRAAVLPADSTSARGARCFTAAATGAAEAAGIRAIVRGTDTDAADWLVDPIHDAGEERRTEPKEGTNSCSGQYTGGSGDHFAVYPANGDGKVLSACSCLRERLTAERRSAFPLGRELTKGRRLGYNQLS